MEDKKIDPESQAMWNELRRIEPAEIEPLQDRACCNTMKVYMREYPQIVVSLYRSSVNIKHTLNLNFCPHCGRRLR